MELTQEQIDAITKKYLTLMPGVGGDPESDHTKADAILVEILKDLGLDEIVAAYESISKWYA